MEKGVLFVCTGNAARSQMAEGLARRMLPPQVPVFSAGTKPAGLDPRAVAAMAEWDADISGHESKRLEDVPLSRIGLTVTLCGEAEEACPVIPGIAREHWPIDDPAPAKSPEGGLPSFRLARDELGARISGLAGRIRPEPAIGVIGGTGFYELPGLEQTGSFEVETPFGRPSGPIVTGRLRGRRIVFLARHGAGHSLLPSEVNARANVYALKLAGVERLVSVSAVGSLREEIVPGEPVFPTQFIDMTAARQSTFFGRGVVGHVSLADPVCSKLSSALSAASRASAGAVHEGGTYLCIEGPAFSTRAESELWRQWGAAVVGMTCMPEARLAREAELCYAALALPTDYDCWRRSTSAVSVGEVMACLAANTGKAKAIIASAVASIEPSDDCACGHALDNSLLTPMESIGPASRFRMHAILARRLGKD